MKKLDVNMWRTAIWSVPQVTKEQWKALDIISKWLVSTRAFAIIMTFTSAVIVALIALREGTFNLGLWLLVLVGLIFAHATNNLLNDYTDYVRGIDEDNYFRDQYGPQPLGQGFVSKRQLLLMAALNGLIATAAGVALIFLRGGITVWLMLAGAVIVLLYTYPLKYIALGELSMLIAWGPLMVGGGYYVLSGVWSWNVALAGLVYSLGVTATLIGKHVDKYKFDKDKGVHTVPVVIGEKAARYLGLGMFVLEYLLVFYLVGIGFFSPFLLVILFGLPSFFKMVLPMWRHPRPEEPPPQYPKGVWPLWFVGTAFSYARQWGFYYLLGLILDMGYVLIVRNFF